MMNSVNAMTKTTTDASVNLRHGGKRSLWMRRLVATTLISGSAILSPWQAEANSIAPDTKAGVEVAQSSMVTVDIPAQSLDRALTSLADQANLKLFFPSEGLGGLEAPALQGEMAIDAALTTLLRGSGYTWRYTDGGTVTIEKLSANGEEVLDPVVVEGQSDLETAQSHVDGYVAKRTTAGTKTDTALVEVPQTVSVVTSDEIKDRNSKTLSEVTKYSPGVLSDLYGADPRGFDKLYMRGFTNYQSGDFRDGLRMASAGFAVYATEPYGLERVDILKGANASIYGQGDAGGVVNRVTKRPDADQQQEIVAEAGSWNHFQGAFDIGGAATEDESVLFRVNGVVRDANGEYEFLNGEEQKNNRIYLAPSITYQPNSDTSLTVLSDYLFDDRSASYALVTLDGTNHGFLSGEPGFDEFENQQFSVTSILDHRVNDTWKLNQKTNYTSIDTQTLGVVGLGQSGSTIYRRAYMADNHVQSLAVDNYAEGKFGGGDFEQTVLVGADFGYSFNDYKYMQSYPADTIDLNNPAITGATSYSLSPSSTGTTTTDYEQTTKQFGLYAQDQIRLDEKWLVTLGGRYSYVENDFDFEPTGFSTKQEDDAFTGRVALSYLFENGVSPYVSYSEGFAPTSGTDSSGNVFDPEESEQYEVGVKYQPVGTDALVTASVYQLTKENALATDPSNSSFKVQTDEVRSRGFEFEAKAGLGGGWDITAAYAYTDSEIIKSVDGNAGNEGTWVPTNTASSWLNYTFTEGQFDGLRVGVGARYVGSYYVNQTNTLKIDSYALMDMGIDYAVTENITLGVNATNLLDKEYVTTCDVSSVCYAGDGRKVYANLTYNW